MNEFLVGCDVRELCFDMEDMWPTDRRAMYLLKPSIEKPFSVDTLVWPSIFDTGQGAGWFHAARKSAGLEDYQPPSCIGRNMDLWEDLPEMLSVLKTQPGLSACESMTIAITLVVTGSGSSIKPPYPLRSFDVGTEWRLLGFDVADSFQLSGISNCGYTDEEVEARSPDWASLLNSNHLFTLAADAEEFRHYTDQRVPEHSPFHVYGLWRLGPESPK